MEQKLPILDELPRESMLTYAVLFGRQCRKNDPYALGAQIMDLAVQGDCTIVESAYGSPDLALHITPAADKLEEEAEFIKLLQKGCPTPSDGSLGLTTLLSSKPLANDMQVLWKRVVMMHHANYNKDRPLYNADPSRLQTWQRFRRTLGWVLAIGSVYAEPGVQGRLGGVDQVQKGYEEPAFLGNTAAGRVLCRKVLRLRRQMLELAQSDKAATGDNIELERALPYALLFDDELKTQWPTFLSRHYSAYPTWLKPAEAVEDTAGRQKHIASVLQTMGTLHFPAGKRRGRPA